MGWDGVATQHRQAGRPGQADGQGEQAARQAGPGHSSVSPLEKETRCVPAYLPACPTACLSTLPACLHAT